jgi:hypothetical protein
MSKMPPRELKPGKRRYPAVSAEMKRRWQTPEYQAKQAAGRERRAEDQRRRPEHYSRLGVPNGWRRPEAIEAWKEASAIADIALKGFEAIGAVPEVVIPDSDDKLSKLALRELCKIAFGPADKRTRIAAGRLILMYTKPVPAQHLEVRSTAEDWLRSALVAGSEATAAGSTANP